MLTNVIIVPPTYAFHCIATISTSNDIFYFNNFSYIEL
jgi:hypothetical protein